MILFLDFDGVLHPDGCEPRDLFCNRQRFEACMLDFYQVEIVVSSSWRLWVKNEERSLIELRQRFAVEIGRRIVGMTPDCRVMMEIGALDCPAREWECLRWMAENRPTGTTWLALDAARDLFSPLSRNLMPVNGKKGFSASDEGEFRLKLQQLEGKTNGAFFGLRRSSTPRASFC